jgi:hypothetical protein
MKLRIPIVVALAAATVLALSTVPAQAGNWPGDHQLLGAGVEDPYEFGSWLGRPVQVWQTWNNFPDWATMETVPPAHLYFTGEGDPPFDQRFPGRMSMGQPLFAADETVADCAGGGDDAHYTNIARELERIGFGDTIVRLAWEQNGDWQWWHATTANAADWVTCFRHAYQSFKAVDHRFVIEWNPNKSTDMPGFDTRLSYPGDQYVDVVGVDFYDHYPPYPDQAAWDANYGNTENGGSPTGMGAWIAFARMHHKQIAFPEWGLDRQNDPDHPDNGFFVTKMADTFAALGPWLFEQSYFALPAGAPCNFEIHVNGCNPEATAAYLQRFGR